LNSRPPVKPAVANEPFKHVIDEYKHQAQTITCTCGWHGSSATIDRGGSEWTAPPARGSRQEALGGAPSGTTRPGSTDPGRFIPGSHVISGSLSRVDLPATPPFVLRGRLLTPLGGSGTRFERDGLLAVDAGGRITFAGAASERADVAEGALDVRPWVLLPGMVDLHAHLPQLPNAGLGAGMDLLAWLER
jgi:hypothetical protein